MERRGIMQVKFCGLRTMADVEAANRVHPDMAGFVFAHGSSRRIDARTAALLRSRLDPSIRAVGVFCDQDPAAIEELVKNGIIDMIQLHGSEPEEQVRRLKRKAPVIRAFRIRSVLDLEAARKTRADMVLLDAGAGEGKTFDWSLTAGFDRPYILAGGLTPENVRSAAALQPWGLDVSSGIETRGRKDPGKMQAFMEAAGCRRIPAPKREMVRQDGMGWARFLLLAASTATGNRRDRKGDSRK